MNQDEEIAVSLSMIEMIKLLGLMVWRKCHDKAVTTIQPTNRCYWECATLSVAGRMDQDENVFLAIINLLQPSTCRCFWESGNQYFQTQSAISLLQ